MDIGINPNFLFFACVGAALAIVLLSFANRPIINTLRAISILFLAFIAVTHFKSDIIAAYNQVVDAPVNSAKKRTVNLTAGAYIVDAEKLNVRIAPNKKGQVIATLIRGNEVNVYDSRGSYARISEYFNGSGYGKSGNIAQWIAADYLTEKSTLDKSSK